MDQTVVLSILGIVLGLIGLWWSSGKSVVYSIKLSKIFGITTFFIGFVLIAVSTGLPELAIMIISLWKKVPEISAGDIIGSNLIDISLVLGLPAILLGTLNVKKNDKLPLMLMLLVTSLVMAFVFVVGVLTPIYGAILILLYFVSIWWLWHTKATRLVREEEAVRRLGGNKNRIQSKPLSEKLWIVAKLLFSLSLVIIFSKIAIDCTITLTNYFKFSLEALGATVFAVGTSLPELALCMQAVRKKEYSLAFGNAFGSVLEQATLILGFLVISSKKPINITVLRPVAPIMFLAYAVMAHSFLKKPKVGRQVGLGRIEGLILLFLFILHMVYYLGVFK